MNSNLLRISLFFFACLSIYSAYWVSKNKEYIGLKYIGFKNGDSFTIDYITYKISDDAYIIDNSEPYVLLRADDLLIGNIVVGKYEPGLFEYLVEGRQDVELFEYGKCRIYISGENIDDGLNDISWTSSENKLMLTSAGLIDIQRIEDLCSLIL